MSILITAYFAANCYLTGVHSDDLSINKFTFKKVSGVFVLLIIYLLFLLPILIIDEAVDFYTWTKGTSGIKSDNIVYIIYKALLYIKRKLKRK